MATTKSPYFEAPISHENITLDPIGFCNGLSGLDRLFIFCAYNAAMANLHKKQSGDSSLIAKNKKARYEYAIETSYEAGLVLEGWEVKSLRAGRAQLTESYVIIKQVPPLAYVREFPNVT